MHRYNSEPIQIGRLQRYAMDSFQATGEELLTAPRGRATFRLRVSAAVLPHWRAQLSSAVTVHRPSSSSATNCSAA